MVGEGSMFLRVVGVLLIALAPGASRSQGTLQPGGVLNAVDGITILANSPEFEVARTVMVERIEPADLPRAFSDTETSVAPFYRFSGDEYWYSGHRGVLGCNAVGVRPSYA